MINNLNYWWEGKSLKSIELNWNQQNLQTSRHIATIQRQISITEGDLTINKVGVIVVKINVCNTRIIVLFSFIYILLDIYGLTKF